MPGLIYYDIFEFSRPHADRPHGDTVNALRRGESLHVRSLKGEWLKAYYWSETRPIEHDWVTGANRPCAIADIPMPGKHAINGEACDVLFYVIGDQPIWHICGAKNHEY